MFDIFPQIIQTVFAENCVAVVFILAVILNLILPDKKMLYDNVDWQVSFGL